MGLSTGPSGGCDVLDIGCDNLVAVVTDLLHLGLAVAGDERCEVEPFRALLSVVDDAHAVVGVRLNVRQEREKFSHIVLRADVQDAERALTMQPTRPPPPSLMCDSRMRAKTFDTNHKK